jgi:TPR repeat protein
LQACGSQSETRRLTEHELSPAGAQTAVLRLEPTRALPPLQATSDEAAPEEAHHTDFAEIRWLRDKHLMAEAPQSRTATSQVRWYASAALVLLVIAVLFYARSKPGRPTTSGAQPPAVVTQSTFAHTVVPNQATAVDRTQATTQPKVEPQAPSRDDLGPATSSTAGKPALVPSSASADTSAPAEAPLSSASGAAEFAQAENLLNGKNGTRDTVTAARWLWIAVGKENTSAILLLSDMYLIGDGVPKSCDQAKVLLMAAARKHVLQAADKLRDLEQSGCP